MIRDERSEEAGRGPGLALDRCKGSSSLLSPFLDRQLASHGRAAPGSA